MNENVTTLINAVDKVLNDEANRRARAIIRDVALDYWRRSYSPPSRLKGKKKRLHAKWFKSLAMTMNNKARKTLK